MVQVVDRERLRSQDPIRFAHVLPGAYVIHLDRHDEAASEFVPAGPTAPATVAADQTTEVTL